MHVLLWFALLFHHGMSRQDRARVEAAQHDTSNYLFAVTLQLAEAEEEYPQMDQSFFSAVEDDLGALVGSQVTDPDFVEKFNKLQDDVKSLHYEVKVQGVNTKI